MNKRVIVYVLGAVLLIEAALMLLPLLVAVIYREKSGWYFLWVLLGAAVLGALALGLGGRKRSAMYAKEGLIAVALSWIVLSLVGALPFTLSGQIPFYLDAVFEMISGFTTTGSSILPAVEPLDRCMLFWRSLSHWIGGMGILVFMLAIVRMDGGQAIHLLRADVETELSPMVGGEQESEQLIRYLLSEYEEDTEKLWESNLFGKSLYELVSEGVTAKIMRMPDDARQKLTKTLGRMINENTGGMICILL